MSLLQNRRYLIRGPQTVLFNGYYGYFQGVKPPPEPEVDHLHLVPRLKISGVTPLLSPYVFRVWTGIILRFYFSVPELRNVTNE